MAGKKQKVEAQKAYQAKVDHIIMRLICVRGLVPHILDSPEWKELMRTLNGQYHPTSSDLFEQKFIPQEAIYVREKTDRASQERAQSDIDLRWHYYS
jgi:hypothetical protein